jgi:transcriptional regulator with XRE-family HTH domain
MRQLRKTAGFSQDRLGRASDLSGKFIGEVERGEKSISLDSLTRISEALKVPLHDLARIDQSLPGHSNQVQLEQLTAARPPASEEAGEARRRCPRAPTRRAHTSALR